MSFELELISDSGGMGLRTLVGCWWQKRKGLLMRDLVVVTGRKTVRIRELTFSEFLKMMRPSGYGEISVSVGTKTVEKIRFTEVVCDFCNDEIPPKKFRACPLCNGTGKIGEKECELCPGGSGRIESHEESFVFLLGSYALCDKCLAEIEERGKPS